MRYTLENETLKIEIESKGAELKSVINKETGLEYMWQADPEFWGRTSPVLFPFVGEVKDGHYFFEGKEYKMGQHGFARDTEFEIATKEAGKIWFQIKDSEDTYNKYPFHFKLEIGYELIGNKVNILWKVTNPGQDREDQTLYFSIGAHPAFNCPINGDEDKNGYKMFFKDAKEIRHHGNLTGTCTHEDLVLALDANGCAEITAETFNRSTYIVENKQTDSMAILDRNGKAYIIVDFDTPLFGVWSPIGKNAPFVCIEPWWGRADYDDFAGELPDREYGNTLESGQVFDNIYSITFA